MIRKQPTPRKGTETPDSPWRSLHPEETTHTPQGDGNRRRSRSVLLPTGNNPHPARGRKQNLRDSYRSRKRNNPHPARGRKPSPPAPRPSSPGNNPHPARGRKLVVNRKDQVLCIETTHTPQGDGNYHCGISFLFGNNPHPARGRKRCHLVHILTSFQKQPTPRKGTETGSRSCPHPLTPETTHTPQGDGNFRGFHTLWHTLRGNNPHPARGRKLVYPLTTKGQDSKQPTPRKGTENHFCLHCRNCSINHSHP